MGLGGDGREASRGSDLMPPWLQVTCSVFRPPLPPSHTYWLFHVLVLGWEPPDKNQGVCLRSELRTQAVALSSARTWLISHSQQHLESKCVGHCQVIF